MRALIAISILLVGLLLVAGCTDKGTGGTTPAGGTTPTGGTVQPSGNGGTVAGPTFESATSSDFDNPVEGLTEPAVDATDEEFEMPA